MDLVALVRARRLRWLGHVLRAEESYLMKKVVVIINSHVSSKLPDLDPEPSIPQQSCGEVSP